ncbi:MAG: hypothetical protein ABIS50_10200 [Luteolibacter sp.]|uniref:hypothetical protein n=1 Tax=Luteolibacter sp. TaxID=1962973 RepID=UPI003265C48D
MPLEIERKFLVANDSWCDGSPGIGRGCVLKRSAGKMKRIFIPAFSILIAGCAALSTGRKGSIMVMEFDNHGGFSHAGRKIEFFDDKRFRDTRYTDVRGDDQTEDGTYEMGDGRITLEGRGRDREVLCRARFEGEVYWVHSGEEKKVAKPGESHFRQISLRQNSVLSAKPLQSN